MTTPATTDWTIPGSDGRPIRGTTHLPRGRASGVAIVAHGFLGYKDYGLLPAIARHLSADDGGAGAGAGAGMVVHRFNFSHSGVGAHPETFEHPELLECDTWMRQVHDLHAVIDAGAAGAIPGGDLPVVLIGHSRGGVACLLAAGRRYAEGRRPLPAAVCTLAAPSRACMWDAQTQRTVLEQGHTEVRSNRTGQTLRIDAAWLREQLDDPGAHDVVAHARSIPCPLLIVHGEVDPTVPVECAHELAAAETARLVLIEEGDHVFNTPNPMPVDASPSPQLATVLDAVERFCKTAQASRM